MFIHFLLGKDQREERSPSFFNPEECWQVMDYVNNLLTARGLCQVKQKQIGIISPYRKQVCVCRAMPVRNAHLYLAKDLGGNVLSFAKKKGKIIIRTYRFESYLLIRVFPKFYSMSWFLSPP